MGTRDEESNTNARTLSTPVIKISLKPVLSGEYKANTSYCQWRDYSRFTFCLAYLVKRRSDPARHSRRLDGLVRARQNQTIVLV